MQNQINYSNIVNSALVFAKHLQAKSETIASALSSYQCYNVTEDEIERSVDFLVNLEQNKEYFRQQVTCVTSFLPLNQPLYATICFAVIPSLMSKQVYVRPPTAMHKHYEQLVTVLELKKFFPNICVSFAEKEDFLAEVAHITDAVIFTGTPENANKVRKNFLRKTLFILNGSGHNPLVITENANCELALASALRVVTYNQGQDCAGPNAILVHESLIDNFRKLLFHELNAIESQVGPYSNPQNIVGPNSDKDHAVKIAKLFAEERMYCTYGGEVNVITGMIKPTVFEKPLALGGNYKEFFAPVFYLQAYKNDQELESYFSDPKYAPNAMYISIFGDSPYIESLIGGDLHLPDSILRNTDLHQEEKGYQPYGGQGAAASCMYVNGERIVGATLPQRDIYNYLIKPHEQVLL